MATTLQKIQDTARRIGRLGRYASESGADPGMLRIRVTKDHGALQISSSLWTFMCIPREGRVWLQSSTISPPTYGAKRERDPDLAPEEALRQLLQCESGLLEQARAKAREEVIGELVDRKIRRVIRAKTRGFKDQRKKAKKRGVSNA